MMLFGEQCGTVLILELVPLNSSRCGSTRLGFLPFLPLAQHARRGAVWFASSLWSWTVFEDARVKS